MNVAIENSTLTKSQLESRFERYSTKNLVGIEPDDFQSQLESRIGKIDGKTEGYRDDEIERQRDLSIKYHWGHDHNFGSFHLAGKMKNRHLNLMVSFAENFPIDENTFADADVIDIGCWTGGTTLLLHSLGSRVHAIEEVKKYSDTVNFLASSFGIGEQVHCESQSLYECNSDEYHDRFDVAYFPGVIYHLSDPVLALRILFNSLRMDGEILIESAGIDSPEPVCRFDGNYIYHNGSREELSRAGWNWFLPSESALERMMQEAGFGSVKTFYCSTNRRVFGYGKKKQFVGICKAGLSVPDIL